MAAIQAGHSGRMTNGFLIRFPLREKMGSQVDRDVVGELAAKEPMVAVACLGFQVATVVMVEVEATVVGANTVNMVKTGDRGKTPGIFR